MRRSAAGSTPRARTRKAASAAPAAALTTGGGRGGRPSRQQAAQLGERILDAATHLFLSHGYGATSIEAVAGRARISKRTLYHRFPDKPALFTAVVHRIIEGLRPPAGIPLLEGDLDEILRRLAGLILRAALSPQAIALNRMIVAESGRFPRLAAVTSGATDEAIRLIAGILEDEVRANRLALANPAFAAQQFLYMIIALPQRRAMGFGAPMSSAEIDAWAADVVNLFLNGCRGGSRAAR
ncbi:MAG TPA: TetR/AcrR family transcriptional regulator [Casimicrobiaceae bacterium]|nr:TetR/AcrR family transcriptional regulator [Casimicrobiaceae bacterium]